MLLKGVAEYSTRKVLLNARTPRVIFNAVEIICLSELRHDCEQNMDVSQVFDVFLSTGMCESLISWTFRPRRFFEGVYLYN